MLIAKPLAAAILALAAATPSFAGHYCSLPCSNGGTCVTGASPPEHPDEFFSSPPDDEDTGLSGMRCKCLSGWTGAICEISDSNQDALLVAEGREVALEASTENAATVIRYCTQENDVSYQAYCLNGGLCKSYFPSDTEGEHPGCHCPAHSQGEHCEVHEEDTSEIEDYDDDDDDDDQGDDDGESYGEVVVDTSVEDITYCTLGTIASASAYCSNGGVCKSYLPSDTEGEHPGCICPQGWDGENCEVRVDQAYDDEENNAEFAESLPVADGIVITYCTEDQSFSSSAFCVNGGICKSMLASSVEGQHPGCHCPSNWEGDNCQVHAEEFVTATSSNQEGEIVFDTPTSQTATETDDQSFEGYGDNNDDEEVVSVNSAPESSPGVTYCVVGDVASSSAYCQNGGICKAYIQPSSEEEHPGCYCKQGWAGEKCEVEVITASSPETFDLDFDGSDDHQAPDDSSLTPSTVVSSCVLGGSGSASLASSASYCSNGGICKAYLKPDMDEQEHPGCYCPPNYNGDHCEIRVEMGEQGGVSEETFSGDAEQESSGDFAYGSSVFTGEDSAFHDEDAMKTVEVCGDNVHYCFYGSTCLARAEDNVYRCDCSTASGGGSKAFAGKSCEYRATEVCVIGVDFGAEQPHSFCTNGGKCKAKISSFEEPHPGCDCPNNYRGDRCEVPHVPNGFSTGAQQGEGDSHQATTTAKKKQSMESFEIFLLILTVLLVATLALCLTKRMITLCKRRRKAKLGVEGSLWFRSGEHSYRDEENVSPRRESMVDPFPSRYYSSSQDPSIVIVDDEPTRQVKTIQNGHDGGSSDSDHDEDDEELPTSQANDVY